MHFCIFSVQNGTFRKRMFFRWEIRSTSSLKIQQGAMFYPDGTSYCSVLFLTEIVACVSMAARGFPAAVTNEYEAISLVETAPGPTFHCNEGSWGSSKYNDTKCFPTSPLFPLRISRRIRTEMRLRFIQDKPLVIVTFYVIGSRRLSGRHT